MQNYIMWRIWGEKDTFDYMSIIVKVCDKMK